VGISCKEGGRMDMRAKVSAGVGREPQEHGENGGESQSTPGRSDGRLLIRAPKEHKRMQTPSHHAKKGERGEKRHHTKGREKYKSRRDGKKRDPEKREIRNARTMIVQGTEDWGLESLVEKPWAPIPPERKYIAGKKRGGYYTKCPSGNSPVLGLETVFDRVPAVGEKNTRSGEMERKGKVDCRRPSQRGFRLSQTARLVKHPGLAAKNSMHAQKKKEEPSEPTLKDRPSAWVRFNLFGTNIPCRKKRHDDVKKGEELKGFRFFRPPPKLGRQQERWVNTWAEKRRDIKDHRDKKWGSSINFRREGLSVRQASGNPGEEKWEGRFNQKRENRLGRRKKKNGHKGPAVQQRNVKKKSKPGVVTGTAGNKQTLQGKAPIMYRKKPGVMG